MTGAFDSVIGMNKENSIEKFLSATRVKFLVAEKNCRINGAVFTIDNKGSTIKITRIDS